MAALPELLDGLGASPGGALLDWGYLILVATLVQAVLLSAVLVLLPLWLGTKTRPGAGRWRVVAVLRRDRPSPLFVEIASIQRFTLFLAHPLYAIGVVLAGFCCSRESAAASRRPRAAPRRPPHRALTLAIAAIVVLAIAYIRGPAAIVRRSGRLARPSPRSSSRSP